MTPVPEQRAQYITLRIDRLLLEEIEVVVQKSGKSRNFILNTAIREWLEEYKVIQHRKANNGG